MAFIRPINTKGESPKISNSYSPAHLGIDYAYNNGEPIYASEDGTISFVKKDETRQWLANTNSDPFPHPRSLNNADYGNMIKIQHTNGYSTLYAHLKPGSVLVTPGAAVQKGQKIAEVGSTGNSTGNHLHWELRKNDFSIDPSHLVDKSFSNYFINSGNQDIGNNMTDQEKKDIESMKALRVYKNVWYESKYIISDFEELKKERDLLGKENSRKDSEIKAKEDTINSLNQLVTEKTNQITKLQSTVSTLEHQLLDSETKITGLEEQAKKVPELLKKIDYLEGMKTVWNKKESSYKENVEKYRKESLTGSSKKDLVIELLKRLTG